MDKLNEPISRASPNLQRQFALQREHKKLLELLHERNFKDQNVEAKVEEED